MNEHKCKMCGVSLGDLLIGSKYCEHCKPIIIKKPIRKLRKSFYGGY